MIAIIDYGVGNLCNLKNALDFQGVPCEIVTDPARADDASHLILPGVGAFRPAMERLRQSAMEEAVARNVGRGKPFLGICVGLQLMFQESEENGRHQGMGLLDGRIIRFDHGLKIPQIGWNRVAFQRRDPLLEGIPDGSYFYFVHSYHASLSNMNEALGLADYGISFPAIVQKDNMRGVQFHPEKSQNSGLRLLKNFANLTPE